MLRSGGGIVYDHYGSAMVASFASSGSPGLATTVAQPVNTNFTTAFRYTGSALPTLPASGGGAFPYTPPVIQGGFTTFSGVASDLKAPYSYVINANYARPLPHGMSLELGYAGRLSHRGILNQDFAQPMTKFTDPKSGQSWLQASTVLAQLFNNGVTPAQVKANPGLVPEQPFFTNIFPGAKNQYITGSASANFFYDVFGNYSGSFLDGLNDMDRIRLPGGGCVAVYGCNTFFPLQNSGLDAYVNAGKAAYHAATIVIRRPVTHGWGYDFNYTFSHSLDNGSASETSGGAALQDAFNPNAFRGPSDFDARHTITADAVVDLPVGQGEGAIRPHAHLAGLRRGRMAGKHSVYVPHRTAANVLGFGRVQRELRYLGVLHREAGFAAAGERVHVRQYRRAEHFRQPQRGEFGGGRVSGASGYARDVPRPEDVE